MTAVAKRKKNRTIIRGVGLDSEEPERPLTNDRKTYE